MGKLQFKKKTTDVANFIAIALALEVLSGFLLPSVYLGGQITLVSSLPILLIAFRHGKKTGLISAGIFALAQLILDVPMLVEYYEDRTFLPGKEFLQILLLVILDYAIPYTALGLGGIFRRKVHPRTKAFPLGCLLAIGIRSVSHLACRWAAFGHLASYYFSSNKAPVWGKQLAQGLTQETMAPVFAAVCTGIYMLPELVLTVIAAWALSHERRLVCRIRNYK